MEKVKNYLSNLLLNKIFANNFFKNFKHFFSRDYHAWNIFLSFKTVYGPYSDPSIGFSFLILKSFYCNIEINFTLSVFKKPNPFVLTAENFKYIFNYFWVISAYLSSSIFFFKVTNFYYILYFVNTQD